MANCLYLHDSYITKFDVMKYAFGCKMMYNKIITSLGFRKFAYLDLWYLLIPVLVLVQH